VTRVEEWTRAEIGVGAAIAIGSQGEKGKIALFVMKVSIKKRVSRALELDEVNTKKSGRR